MGRGVKEQLRKRRLVFRSLKGVRTFWRILKWIYAARKTKKGGSGTKGAERAINIGG